MVIKQGWYYDTSEVCPSRKESTTLLNAVDLVCLMGKMRQCNPIGGIQHSTLAERRHVQCMMYSQITKHLKMKIMCSKKRIEANLLAV